MNKKLKSEYKRKGRCKRCGRCCNIRHLLKTIPLRQRLILLLIPRFLKAYLLNKSCPNLEYQVYLDPNGGEKIKIAECQIYEKRPWFCKAYPSEPSDLIHGCGYRFKNK